MDGSIDFAKLWDEHEFVWEGEGLVYGVDKVGGGTVGRRYNGDWKVTVYDFTGARLEEIPVTTGIAHTHEWVAQMVNQGYGDE